MKITFQSTCVSLVITIMTSFDKIATLKQEIKELDEKKMILKKQLMELDTSHEYSSLYFPLPLEIANLKIYIPDKFNIYHTITNKTNKYIVEYDNHTFSIEHDPGAVAKCPYTFNINGITYTESIQSSIPLFVYLYYANPGIVHNVKSLQDNTLSTFEMIFHRAPLKMDNEWHVDMYFGLALFYYWIKIYYKNDQSYPDLYAAFEKVKNV